MIYDIIELPMRDVSGELSSILPRFKQCFGGDDVDWYGRTISLDGIRNGLHKYKSIEPSGPMTIERMFMTTEPIDFKKKWHTAQIELFPIMYKVYRYPYTANCEVYRYLNGTMNVLGSIDCFSEMQTIGNCLVKSVYPYGLGDSVSQRTKRLIPHIARGCDSKNLSQFNTMYEFVQGDENCYFVDQPITVNDMFSEYPADTAEDLYLKDIKVSDLKPIITPQCDNGIFRKTMTVCKTPFDINSTTIFNEECDLYRWCLHELIQNIEASVYTDMHIVLTYRDQRKVSAQIDMFSRYVGFSHNTIPGEEKQKSTIVELLRKWAGLTSGCTPTSVELWKNWAEEIFISVKSPNGNRNYYFDITTYSLTNLSFVDTIG